jgi:iron complex outermembrane receptor protein
MGASLGARSPTSTATTGYKPMNKTRSTWLLAALAVPSFLIAQTAPAPSATDSSDDSTVKLQAFTVTGSNIPQAADALSVPVSIITPEQIQESGEETNVLDLLRKISPAITGIGGENATIGTANTYGGSTMQIHNLPTLVLIDGRRMAYNPADGGGGLEFVDLNMIPVAAIERVEVLSDGASAIYGGDAVGGVVNIILKKDFNGWQLNSHYGISDNPGHYTERTFSLVGGVKDDATSITSSVEYSKSDPIFESQRNYTNPFYATTYVPGIVEIFGLSQNPAAPGYGYDEAFQLAAGTNAPPGGGNYTMAQLVAMGVYKDLGSFNSSSVISQIQHVLNLAEKESLQEASKRASATVDVEHKVFGDKLVAFGDFIYSHSNTFSQLNAQPLFPYISDVNSDLGVYGVTPPTSSTEFVPITAPTNPISQTSLDQGSTDGSGGYAVLVHNRFVDYPREFQNDSSVFRAIAGLKGQIDANWSWETAVDISRDEVYYTNPGVLSNSGLISSFQSGTVNPFAIEQAPGALTGVVGTAFDNMISSLNSWDAVLRGVIVDLPAGALNFAVGGQLNRQNLTAVPDFNSANDLWIDSPTILAFNRNRTVTSIYGELELPIVAPANKVTGIYALNADYAERLDHYSTLGNSTVPKIDVKYQPFDDQLTLRGSAGKSFIAPTLYDLYGPVIVGTSDSITYNGANGTQYSSVQFQDVSGSNPELKPSTSTTWTAGFVYTPKAVKNLSVTFDYYQTVEKGVVSSIDQSTIVQSVENLGAASPYAQYIHFLNANGPGVVGNTPGQISSRPLSEVFLITPQINLGSTAIRGYDAAVNYAYHTAGFGKFEFSSSVTVYDSFRIQELPTENYYQYAGHVSTVEALVAGIGGTIPRWRTYSSIDWKLKGLDVLVGQTFVPSVTDIGSGGLNASPGLNVASYDQYDVVLGYDFSRLNLNPWLKRLSVRIGVNNAFNYQPPVAPYRLQLTLADTGTYGGAIGRLFYVDASLKF